MIDDAMNRLKVKRGSELPWSKLHENDVMTIRNLIAFREAMKERIALMSNQKIAEKYGVHRCTIDKISQGITWGHVA